MTEESLPFISRRRIEFSQTDMAGIVHFSNYYKWMEETEHDFFRSLGLSIMERQADGTYIGWPRVNANCHYQAPVHYDEIIEGRLKVERIGAKSLTFYIEFWRDETRVAWGRMKSACCICRPDGTLTSILIPENYVSKLEKTMAPGVP
ncbi:acyl-CoA thioesterase [Planctomicrobium sp. SH661]|uniref:acyl-CoA thioesterase n=1 Tax=Planctomicrobium sp. SH661 TaxID=3448124 RepID=UPI003F5BB36D